MFLVPLAKAREKNNSPGNAFHYLFSPDERRKGPQIQWDMLKCLKFAMFSTSSWEKKVKSGPGAGAKFKIKNQEEKGGSPLEIPIFNTGMLERKS